MSLLSWMKGLFRKEKKVTYKTIRQKIKEYNKREYEEFRKQNKRLYHPNHKVWRHF